MPLDIIESNVIEQFKRRNNAPLVEWWKRLKGKPPSPLLHQFILDLLEGKELRRRGRPNTPVRMDILMYYTALRRLCPSTPKEELIKITASEHNVGIKTAERIIYRLKQKPSPRLTKK